MLCVHEGHLAALLLGLGQHVKGQGGLTGGFRPIDLNDASLGKTAHTQRQIQRQGAGGDHINIHFNLVPQTHDAALAEILFDLGQCRFQGLFLVRCGSSCFKCRFALCHM